MAEWIVDADAHMLEPPNLWVERLDRKYRDRAPRLEMNPGDLKGVYFLCDNLKPMPFNVMFAAGQNYDKSFLEVGLDKAPAGGWDPAARLKDMAADGIDAQVLYSTSAFSLFQVQDRDFQEACFRVYNDWLAEFCRHAPEKFAGLALISLHDIPAACGELTRCKAMGLKGALIWSNPPAERPYDSPEYDPFWATAQDLAMPLSFHEGTAADGKVHRTANSGSSNFFRAVTSVVHEIQLTLLSFIGGGVLERFPGLKLVAVEVEVAWIPSMLSRADKYFRRYRKSMDLAIAEPPSTYFRRQVFATFIDDPLGVELSQIFGADNFMWSTDYPHSASTFPNSRAFAAEAFKAIPAADRRKMVQANCAELYDFAREPVPAE
jgi:predicted TIM-barrel fold metal-dependent hydrolase